MLAVSVKRMKNPATCLLAVALAIFGSSKSFAEVPSFLEIEIGGEYPLAVDWSKISSNDPRPTEQFRAPNWGKYSSLFPEYEVAILRENNRVAIVTAERTMESFRTCVEAAEKFRAQFTLEFPALQWNEEQQTYATENGNAFYKVTCKRTGGSPFWQLHYQARGKQQDEQLKAAWGKFLGSSR